MYNICIYAYINFNLFLEKKQHFLFVKKERFIQCISDISEATTFFDLSGNKRIYFEMEEVFNPLLHT